MIEINCASRGFHVHRPSWKSTTGEKLKMEREKGNVHDSLTISISAPYGVKLQPQMLSHIGVICQEE